MQTTSLFWIRHAHEVWRPVNCVCFQRFACVRLLQSHIVCRGWFKNLEILHHWWQNMVFFMICLFKFTSNKLPNLQYTKYDQSQHTQNKNKVIWCVYVCMCVCISSNNYYPLFIAPNQSIVIKEARLHWLLWRIFKANILLKKTLLLNMSTSK